MRTRTRFALPFAVAALATAAAPHATPVADGWKFKWKVSSDMKGGAPPSMDVLMVPGKARMDFVGPPSPGMKPGSYVILDAENASMIIVSPAEKSATVMETGSLASALNAVGQIGLIKMEFSNVKSNLEDLGAGERILGHPTHHYRITRSYYLKVSVLGRTSQGTTNSVTDAWLAGDVRDKVFETWAQNFASSLSGLTGDGFKQFSELEKNAPKGFPLRQIIKTTQTNDKGETQTSTVTSEVEELSQTPIDASAFEIPKDYKVVDMKAMTAEMRKEMEKAKADCEKEKGKGASECEVDMSKVNMDSIRKAVADSMKAAPKNAAIDAVGGGALKKLGGLFGKKPAKPDSTTKKP
jgi:hypothetical protein